MHASIAERRLLNQHITSRGLRRPEDVVAALGAVQAQEYEPAKWALALRMRKPSRLEIQRAFDDGRVLRTHVMRPTWHFVAQADIRWLLDLTAPRVHRILSYYNRVLELDARALTRGAGLIERALGEGHSLTRAELATRLERGGLSLDGSRLARMVMHAELEGIICSGPRRDRQFTYALIAERAPNAVRLPRDEALATLAQRFFSSHGPATIRDFVWWSGLTTADAKRGLEIVKAKRDEVDGLIYWTARQARSGLGRDQLAHLLPIYDEYLVAYRDRIAVPHRRSSMRSSSAESVTFQHTVVIGGQVAGTWRVVRSSRGVNVRVVLVRRLLRTERQALDIAFAQYKKFVEAPVQFAVER